MNEIRNTLISLSVPQHFLGYDYLADAIRFVMDDHTKAHAITTRLYPEIAMNHRTTAARVARAIRHAIEHSFNSAPLEAIEKIFGNTVSARTGKPTNGHFIAAVADHLKARRAEGAQAL